MGGVDNIVIPCQVDAARSASIPGDGVPEILREIAQVFSAGRINDPERVAALQQKAVRAKPDFIDVKMGVPPIQSLQLHQRILVGSRVAPGLLRALILSDRQKQNRRYGGPTANMTHRRTPLGQLFCAHSTSLQSDDKDKRIP